MSQAMEQYLADLHVHSRFSRATSKGLTPRNLAAHGEIKGLTVVGTGDFTHPGWLEELRRDLLADGSGLMRLRDTSGLADELPWLPEAKLSGRVRFMLSAEISSIYKRDGAVRKIHNLVFAPSFEVAEKLNTKLAKVGNLASDGRPILGLDSRHLLEMVLETDPLAFLVPAHIWTPWFSLFGSKSGFDSVEACYGSLSREIFAMETGLSSDPEMNWLLSALDRFRLISNSDAHSGDKLGRECNLFSGDPTYEGIYRALRGQGVGPKFLGTVEFFPEEGKYHLDGHRTCGVVMEPAEAKARGGLCPVCGKPLTLGVLHRVQALADRDQPERPEGMPGFTSLIPLAELAGEVLGVGPATAKTRGLLSTLCSRFGPELTVLRETPAEDLARVNTLLAEAVTRMRRGRVFRQAGFDGQYGRISVFSPEEKRELRQGRFLAVPPGSVRSGPSRAQRDQSRESAPLPSAPEEPEAAPTPGLNQAQAEAAGADDPRLLVVAGPGTGKTHTLMARIATLLAAGTPPEAILAVTFTRRAAAELRERLTRTAGDGPIPRADTLHALALSVWTDSGGQEPVLLSEEAARRLFATVNPELSGAKLRGAWRDLNLAREGLRSVPAGDEPGPAEWAARYARQKADWNLLDFTDLLEFWLEKLQEGSFRPPWTQVLVDEVQDFTPLQLAIVKTLANREGTSLFAIGDPDQSIYGFRGAAADVRIELIRAWPTLREIGLAENYRSAQAVLDLAGGLFPNRPRLLARTRPGATPRGEIQLFQAPTAQGEAGWMGERIRGLLGGTSLTLAGDLGANTLAPGDVAVLVRFSGLVALIRRSLERFGIPCAAPEADAFFNDPRVRLLLAGAGRLLGLPTPEDAQKPPTLPDRILAKGPLGLAAYLEDIPPFDRLFWQGPEFKDLCRAHREHGGWTGLLNFVHTQTELELVAGKAEKVRIMTLHAAKGLEFEAVFLPALEDGILPFAGTDFLSGKPGNLAGQLDEDEERRLFYVGLTRAKSRLYLSHAVRRDLMGRRLMLRRSRFLDRLDLSGVRRSALVARTKSEVRQLPLFSGDEATR
jgi:uncharacterized protein (TIGR00375 family)